MTCVGTYETTCCIHEKKSVWTSTYTFMRPYMRGVFIPTSAENQKKSSGNEFVRVTAKCTSTGLCILSIPCASIYTMSVHAHMLFMCVCVCVCVVHREKQFGHPTCPGCASQLVHDLGNTNDLLGGISHRDRQNVCRLPMCGKSNSMRQKRRKGGIPTR